jgi:RNA polymerase sigma-70 factor (ECF subfamily)
MEINPSFSPNAKIDFHVVCRAKEGDQKAYAELMQRYKDSIYFMALKMVNNKDDAMDLTVETFGKAFENLDKYKPDFAFSTWLFRIATNNCIDFIRKKRINVVSLHTLTDNDGEERQLEMRSNTLNPEETSIRKQENEKLKNIVDQLPLRYRTLIILRYFEEQSYEEIAQQLDLPLGTVKAQLFRARDLLSNVMNRKKNNLRSDF